MSNEPGDKKPKPRKIRRRRTTGRVGGTTQSDFASSSMSNILERQAKKQEKEQAKTQAKQKAAVDGPADTGQRDEEG